MSIQRYNQLLLSLPTPLTKPLSLKRKLCSFDESQTGYYFKTTKSDLIRLFSLLDFDDTCRLNNRNLMSGEEVFARGYFELRNGMDQYSICDLAFGGHQL